MPPHEGPFRPGVAHQNGVAQEYALRPRAQLQMHHTINRQEIPHFYNDHETHLYVNADRHRLEPLSPAQAN